jgi:hypothetical protein
MPKATKLFIPHIIEPHDFDAIWQPGNGAVAQLSFFVGDRDVYHVLVGHELLQKTGREIAQLLEEPPSTAAPR